MEIKRNEKGDYLFCEIWFNIEKGVLEATSDMISILSPSDEFLGGIQKGLDEMQKALYIQFEKEIREEVEEEIGGLNINQELAELKDMENMEENEG